MQNIVNSTNHDNWLKPWDLENPIYNTNDERFFSLLLKGMLCWLNENMRMYGKPIKHYILQTGSTYIFLENNGYEFTWCETSDENNLYMSSPRCIIEISNISVEKEELSSKAIPCQYERITNYDDPNFPKIKAFTADMSRIPLQLSINAKYVFNTFNEVLIFAQELFENAYFQKYFNITYLGQVIQNSIEYNSDIPININKPDFTSNDLNLKIVEVPMVVCTNMPLIDYRSEIPAASVIKNTEHNIIHIKNNELLAKYKNPAQR